MQDDILHEFLRKKGDYLFHRESQELEFKEQFNFAGIAEYLKILPPLRTIKAVI